MAGRYQKQGKKVIDTSTGKWLSPEKSQHYADISGGWQHLPDYQQRPTNRVPTTKPVVKPIKRELAAPRPKGERTVAQEARERLAQKPTQTPTPTPTAPAGQPQTTQGGFYPADTSGQRPAGWVGEWTVANQGQLRFGRLPIQAAPVAVPAPTIEPTAEPTPLIDHSSWKNKWQNIAGITGFYRVQGQPTVYAIGEGGGPVSSEEELAWLSSQTGRPLTANQVQEIPASEAAQHGIQVPGASLLPVDEQTQITNEANDIQTEFFKNLPDGDDLDVSASQALLEEILAKLDEAPLEKPPSMAELFAETKASLGMEELETELADIDNEIDAIRAEALIQGEEAIYGQDRISHTQLNRRKGSIQREADNRILRLQVQRGAVARMLNNKISSLNMIMQFTQQDYQNSAAYYKANFDRSIKMYGLIAGQEDREMEIEEKAEQDAKANLTVISTIMQESGNGYDSLTDEQVLQINSLETQAGFPIGLFQFTLDKDPEFKVQTVTSRTDNAGNTYFDVLKIGPDGEMTVDSIYKGKGKVSGGGSLTTKITEIDGKKVLINSKTGETIKVLGEVTDDPTTGELLIQMKTSITDLFDKAAAVDGGGKYVHHEYWNTMRKEWITSTPYNGNKFDNLFEQYINPDWVERYDGQDSY